MPVMNCGHRSRLCEASWNRWCGNRALPKHCANVWEVCEETEHLSRITEQLMTIARLDAGEARAESVTVDLRTGAQYGRANAAIGYLKQLNITIKADIRVNVRGENHDSGRSS